MRYGNATSLAMGIAALLVSATPALARDAAPMVAIEEAVATLAPNQFVWNEVASEDPVSIVVNIGEQRVYVYRGEQLVAAATASTGREGKETPSGTFAILQKKVDHRSNLYDAAPMPFMQRLTWDGVAIHAGRNPGFPASHGCIRVPARFAKRLYEVTTLGTQVTVIGANGEIGPAYLPEENTAEETASANSAASVLAAR